MSYEKEDSQYSGSNDIEKAHPHPAHLHKGGDDGEPHTTVRELEALDDGVPRTKGIFGTLWKLAGRFDALGAETRGIERVKPEDRPVVRIFLCHFILFFAILLTD